MIRGITMKIIHRKIELELIDTENKQLHIKLSSEKMDGDIQLWFTENDYIGNR